MWIECGKYSYSLPEHYILSTLPFIVESVQFAFLAGRILLKDVQYHSSNMSIRVLHCHITWRYWLWKTREGEDIQCDHTAGEEPESTLIITSFTIWI
jgi:hypothetical protein